VQAAWPICLGYVPIGLAFGVLAQKSGLGPLEAGLMSVLVFAGSAQFIAVSMLNTGAGLIPIVLTTFLVNLRHVLMSSTLALHLGRCSKKFLTLFAYGVTDVSFAVNTARFRDGDWHPRSALVLNHTANLVWIVSSMIGAWAGNLIPPGSFGIDYALSAMFICLLVFQLRGYVHVLAGLVAGVLATALALVLPGNLYIVLASVGSATLVFALRRIVPGKGSSVVP
jgi:4-azaleucine resistance transporter AzlC